ncbi:11690_t:CDS:2, partial [Racocetra persica]
YIKKLELSRSSRVVKQNEFVDMTDIADNDFTNFTSSGVSGEFVAYVEYKNDERNNLNKSFDSIRERFSHIPIA